MIEWVEHVNAIRRDGTPYRFEYKTDWGEAAEYASWDPSDVADIIATSEGENEGANWLMVVKLKDGRFSFLSAGCDYTGWDCQASGSSQEYATLEELVRMGLGIEERERLSMPLPAPPEVDRKCCNGGPQWGHAWDCPTVQNT